MDGFEWKILLKNGWFGGTPILGQCGAMLGWWVRFSQDVTFDFPPSSEWDDGDPIGDF